jgi:hypothetical protein
MVGIIKVPVTGMSRSRYLVRPGTYVQGSANNGFQRGEYIRKPTTSITVIKKQLKPTIQQIKCDWSIAL